MKFSFAELAERILQTLVVALILAMINLYLDVDRLKVLADRELGVAKLIHENHEERISTNREDMIKLQEKLKYLELKVNISNQ